ncbi:hypothetical protein V1278_005872 [Bradyrhizobium sp. AZCC 1577]|uniref:hypothetical protein n=1 Tax=Bradyrhizobium sp. AZCC 1577 TaxID=3117019 RepID=UPI002FF0F114
MLESARWRERAEYARQHQQNICLQMKRSAGLPALNIGADVRQRQDEAKVRRLPVARSAKLTQISGIAGE